VIAVSLHNRLRGGVERDDRPGFRADFVEPGCIKVGHVMRGVCCVVVGALASPRSAESRSDALREYWPVIQQSSQVVTCNSCFWMQRLFAADARKTLYGMPLFLALVLV
jgi:hypothetical protein